jgi:putative component of toxin-antitoxin plasmid stabilization module
MAVRFLVMHATMPFTLEFYKDAAGVQPVRVWLRGLTPDQRRSIGAALREVLQARGVAVCGTQFGRQLGAGLFEFRLRSEGLLIRIFCHAHGDKVILLLGGYDKGKSPGEKRQADEIASARRRLAAWGELRRP